MCRATQGGRVMVDISAKTYSLGEGNDKPLQYSCLENPMDREAGGATMYRVTKGQIQLRMHASFIRKKE